MSSVHLYPLYLFFRYHNCTEHSAFNLWLSSFKLDIDKNIKTLYSCADSITQFLCFHRYSPCLVSQINNNTINSPPCERICQRKDCYKLIRGGVRAYTRLYELCPSIGHDPSFFSIKTNCANLPKKDIKHVERCQLIRKLILLMLISLDQLH